MFASVFGTEGIGKAAYHPIHVLAAEKPEIETCGHVLLCPDIPYRQGGRSMAEERKPDRWTWRDAADRLDGFFVPVSFACLTVLVCIQAITWIPAIRARVDAFSGRFVSVSMDRLPPNIQDETALIHLFLAPAARRSDVTLYINNKPAGTFADGNLTVSVREGDKLAVQSSEPGAAMIQVNHDNPYLLTPAPGQTLYVNAPNQWYDWELVRFLK